MHLLIRKRKPQRAIRHFTYQRPLGPSFLLLPQMALDYAIAFLIATVQKVISEGVYRYWTVLLGLLLIQIFPPTHPDPVLEQATALWVTLLEWATIGVIIIHIGIKTLDILRSFRRSKITYSDQQHMVHEE